MSKDYLIRCDMEGLSGIGMEAAVAGDFAVPTVMLTGDSAGVAEAEELLPGIATVSTKHALGETAAVCLPLSECVRKIRQTAAAVVEQPPDVKPYCLGDRVELKARLNRGAYLDTLYRLYKDRMDDDRSLTLTGRSATEVWAEYGQIKLHCLAAV